MTEHPAFVVGTAITPHERAPSREKHSANNDGIAPLEATPELCGFKSGRRPRNERPPSSDELPEGEAQPLKNRPPARPHSPLNEIAIGVRRRHPERVQIVPPNVGAAASGKS